MSMKKEVDHWAFLENFEAPMWADLTAEAKLSNKELDDEWFHRSHKFHQLPSRKLKAAFKNIDSEGKLEIDVGESSSPQIPSSVSKSRGKYYTNDKVEIDFRLSLTGNECLSKDTNGEALQSQCRSEAVPKSANEDSTLSSCLGHEDFRSERLSTITLPNTNNSRSSNYLEHNVVLSDPKSSITSESSLIPAPEVFVASNHIIGRRSELLSVIKQSLRKSCTTRMAVRGQITEVQQTNGLRASFGKSSVGSCSVQSQDVKDVNAAGTQRTSRTPESKIIERLSQESKTRNKLKTSIAGAHQYTNNASVCGNSGEPLKSKVKPGSIYPRNTLNRHSPTTSTSLKINTTSRASKCDYRGKVGMPTKLKISTAAKPTPLVNSNGSILKVIKSSTVNAVSELYPIRPKRTLRKGAMTRISGKDSVGTEVGKSTVTKSSQPQKVNTPKAPLTYRKPLAPVNHNAQGLQRRPLAILKQSNQGSSTFARKPEMKGETCASVKSFGHGKENIGSKLVTSKRQGNSKGSAARDMVEKNYRLNLTEARKNNTQGLISNKEARGDLAHTSKLITKVK